MAAEKLDKLWDESMEKLSESYGTTMSLLEEGKNDGAAQEFRTHFVPAIKKLYAEAAEVYPLRYHKKIEEWCIWTKKLYKDSLIIEGKLAHEDLDEAKELLAGLRKHFYNLHREADMRKVNDFIYIFLLMLEQDGVGADNLKAALEALEKAEPSVKAKAEDDTFEAAKKAWLEAINPVLDGGALGEEQRGALRQATNTFYKAFGIQFE